MSPSLRTKLVAAAISCAAAATVWIGVGGASAAPARPADSSSETIARLFATVAGPDPGAFGTSLEGASFDSAGHFYFVDTTAPAGQPKLMSLDLNTRKVSDLYTDSGSMLNCIAFGPDGTMYLCDIKGGRVVSFNPATHRLTDVVTSVDCSSDAPPCYGGTSFVPDDLTINNTGAMYIADYNGTPTSPTGRILVRQAGTTAAATGLAGVSHPNGIAFDSTQNAIWIDEDLTGTLDHVAYQVNSPASTDLSPTLHTAAYLSLGTNAYTDSLTVDGQGNVYMAVYGGSEVLEFNANGVRIGRVVLPSSAPNVTHVAIQPGTRHAYVTASGPGGGYVYTFQALAAAPAGVPNGG
jgi:lactonase